MNIENMYKWGINTYLTFLDVKEALDLSLFLLSMVKRVVLLCVFENISSVY